MIILKPHDQSGWITAVIEGRWVEAKVYDEPSCYGIDFGRISKIAIGKTDHRNPNANFFEQMCFNYDRGLDFDEIEPELLAKIIEQLEALPKLFEEGYEEAE